MNKNFKVKSSSEQTATRAPRCTPNECCATALIVGPAAAAEARKHDTGPSNKIGDSANEGQ